MISLKPSEELKTGLPVRVILEDNNYYVGKIDFIDKKQIDEVLHQISCSINLKNSGSILLNIIDEESSSIVTDALKVITSEDEKVIEDIEVSDIELIKRFPHSGATHF